MKAWLKIIVVAGAFGAAMASSAAAQTSGCPTITTTTSIGPNGETITRREGCGGVEITSSGGRAPTPSAPPSNTTNSSSNTTTTTTTNNNSRTRTDTRTTTTTTQTAPGTTTTQTRTRTTSVTTPDLSSPPLPPVTARGPGWSVAVGGADTPDDDFGDFPQPPPDFARIVLYDRANFRGRSIGVTQDTPNLERRRFADVASAARVQAGVWELCSEPNYAGTCVSTDSALDLESAALNDTVASVRRVRH